MALIVLSALFLPLMIGILLDYRLGVWPWGILIAVLVGILTATFFVVRSTFDTYRRIEKTHASVSSESTHHSYKEDESA